ncbi:MAG: lytic transglycosylase domain-containing protein [Candidatus Gracilibacteria bacterium]|nr:lytic transglycosylase domain-containing protein [Candidatus Gracilibacteria bacterium]
MSNLSKQLIIFFIILITIFLIVFNILSKKNNSINNNIIFSYPGKDLEFAGEELPDFDKNYFIKERFDKEFLNTSYNLYQFFLYVKRLPLYLPYIEEKLKENNIPLDFKYLPIAESALRNDVVSGAGAAGIWQFIPETAKEYSLIVNDNIDERYNFEKATIGAINHIKDLYSTFKNRTLVAAAYNRGKTGIQNALKDQNVDNYYDLYLNEETGRYVFRILAIKYVIKDYESKKAYINKIIGGVYLEPKIKIIKVGKIDDLKKWALENGQNYQTIKNLNMWILKDFLPDGNWEVKILK